MNSGRYYNDPKNIIVGSESYTAGRAILPVLWRDSNMADIARTLAAAGRRGVDVRMVDTGVTFTAAELNAGLLEALADADETWRRGQTEDGRSASTVAVMAKAEAARRAKLEAARPFWAKPPGEISGTEIARTVGVSLRSLNNWLGPRGKARGQGQGSTRKGS